MTAAPAELLPDLDPPAPSDDRSDNPDARRIAIRKLIREALPDYDPDATVCNETCNPPAVSALDRLPQRRQEALILIVMGRTTGEAAQKLGIDRTTVYRWTRDPEFCAALREVRDERFATARRMLETHVSELVGVLIRIARDPRQLAAVRVRAASELLDRVGFTG